jgi:2-polyprenyl-6-methoxyphenol hydroxylase-like FAD-dependent oxidoreductase
MRTISIIGAGHSGLLLGLGLLERGYDVTIISDRTPGQIRRGFVPSSAGISPDAQDFERELGVNFWDDVLVPSDGVHFEVIAPGGDVLLSIDGPWNPENISWQAVDLRLKCARWAEEFQRRGGNLVIQAANLENIEAYASVSDLTIVAAGKGEIAGLFERDPDRSVYTEAQRHLAMVIVDGHPAWAESTGFECMYFAAHAGVGEIFGTHFLNTTERDAVFMIFEAVPGGPIDRFDDVTEPERILERCKEILKDIAPDQYALARDAQLADPASAIRGRITPGVRRPVATLPSGARVLGLGDVLSLKDPVSGQGANSAAKGARHYLHRIAERGKQPFDAEWMSDVWETFWQDYERYAYTFTNSLLDPPSQSQLALFAAAQGRKDLAAKIFGNFSHPPNAFPWLFDPVEAGRVIDSHGIAPTVAAAE